jgi:pimeloyl-ACP methyl ester carboxylesterase
MYTEERIVTDDSTLSYRYYKGATEEIIFLFHGFGQTNLLFESFIPTVLPSYSVIAVDLFFHGGSYVKEKDLNNLSISSWNDLFARMLDKHHINRFSLLSYSMGSRFVVTLLNTYASQINKIVLIAPDGFGNNFWFNVATSTAATRFVFRYTMRHSLWIKLTVSFLGAIGIFNSITKRFIQRNLENAAHRKKVYDAWVYFRKLSISKKDFVTLIRKNNIRVMCFCGKEDQLVARKTIALISKETDAHYIELDLAHHKLIQALDRNELIDFLISDR